MQIILVFIMIVTSLVLGISFHESFSEELENTYTNEKCGISIQYPKDWNVEESDYVFEDFSKTIAKFQSEGEDIYNLDLSIYNYKISDKSIGSIAEQEKYNIDFPEISILESGITAINGLPTFKMIYVEGLPDKYEYEEDKFRTMEYMIAAYDRQYEFEYQATDKKEFDKYSSIVDEMANTIKITKPNFEGINC